MQEKRISLDGAGRIFWQADASNPLPGIEAAQLEKSGNVLAPAVSMIPGALPEADHEAAKIFIEAWLGAHVAAVLEPLVQAASADNEAPPVREICRRLHEALGILPREELEDQIALLDPDMRKALRGRKIKLGPVLVFMPDLNKPAAVRLRALLWGLHNDKILPMNVPADGIVSIKVEGDADKMFYRTIGYPVYGPRAVRIDMLDRVIVSVYDSAKEGKFQAKHEMAEWLGSSIDDLYLVLEAMGHRKVAEESKPATEPETKTEGAPAAKPELAFFHLKKGKASQSAPARPKNPHFKKDGFKKDDGKKEHKKPPRKKEREKKDRDKKDRGPRVISAAPKVNPEDNPFAILQQLKTKNDGKA